MSYFNNNRWWVLAVVLLLLLNTFTLTIFWIERKNDDRQPPPQNSRNGAKAYLIKELNFDSLQQQAYTKLIEQHQQRTNELRLQIRDAKDAFFSLLGDSAATEDAIAKAAKYAVETEQQLDMLTFNHFKSIRSLCNAEQKKKFDSVIKSAVRMMAPQPPQNAGRDFPPLQDNKHMGPPPPNDEHRPPPPRQ